MKKVVTSAVEFADEIQRGRAGALLEAIHYDHPNLRYGQILFNAMRLAGRTLEPRPTDRSIMSPLIKDTFHLSDAELYQILRIYAKTL